MNKALTVAAAVGLFVSGARAAIQVSSIVVTTDGVRAQAVITDPTSTDERGTTLTAIAIKEFHASIIIRDDVNPPKRGLGLVVQKHTLTSAQAWGQGLPQGYVVPPFTDPSGPWQGTVWPYRDRYDYFPAPGDPLGDDVGIPFFDPPDVYGFLNINGIARGGPTDPVGPPGSSNPNWLNRGITGNGADLEHPATYFAFDVIPVSGDPNRFVRVQIIAASATVVATDPQGGYHELVIPVPDLQFAFIRLPEPTSAMTAGIGLSLLLSGRRRGR